MGDYDDGIEKNKRLRGDEKPAASLRCLTNSWRDFLSLPCQITFVMVDGGGAE